MALEPFAFQERIKVLEVAGRIAQLPFFFLRRSFFAPRLQNAGGRRPPLQQGTNEVERTNILAPGFAFFPPSPPKISGTGPGKLYPVTAAQLLPICTGFLAPIHFFKLAKN